MLTSPCFRKGLRAAVVMEHAGCHHYLFTGANQMGRRETEHEGGKRQAKGKPAAFVLPCAQVGCACSRGVTSVREGE